jgi:hypothetical protein
MPQIRLLIFICCALFSEGYCQTTRLSDSAKVKADLNSKIQQWVERSNKKLGNPPVKSAFGVQFNCESAGSIGVTTPHGYPIKTNGFAMGVLIVDDNPIRGTREQWLKDNMLHWQKGKTRRHFTGILLHEPFPEPSSSFLVRLTGNIGEGLTADTGNLIADLIEDLGSSLGAKDRWASPFMDSLRNPKLLAEQPGAGQPATKPADKPLVNDQPSTPTSKDAPR